MSRIAGWQVVTKAAQPLLGRFRSVRFWAANREERTFVQLAAEGLRPEFGRSTCRERFPTLEGCVLSIAQERGAALSLAEDGMILIPQTLDEPIRRSSGGMKLGAKMVVIQGAFQQRLATALGFVEAVLD